MCVVDRRVGGDGWHDDREVREDDRELGVVVRDDVDVVRQDGLVERRVHVVCRSRGRLRGGLDDRRGGEDGGHDDREVREDDRRYGVLVRDDVDVARQVGHVERRLRIVCDRRGRVLLGLAARRVGGL